MTLFSWGEKCGGKGERARCEGTPYCSSRRRGRQRGAGSRLASCGGPSSGRQTVQACGRLHEPSSPAGRGGGAQKGVEGHEATNRRRSLGRDAVPFCISR